LEPAGKVLNAGYRKKSKKEYALRRRVPAESVGFDLRAN